jgi:hypothetical protein
LPLVPGAVCGLANGAVSRQGESKNESYVIRCSGARSHNGVNGQRRTHTRMRGYGRRDDNRSNWVYGDREHFAVQQFHSEPQRWIYIRDGRNLQ